ncbi:MAG TPA: GerMN domain-containing protein [Acidimicrobiales bacterium]|jgi:spore germination protein GerM|nr:GerMN domain-containing protein [Acidimicrobiales bacterium]
MSRRLLALVVVLGLIVAACGVAANGEPEVIGDDEVPADLISPNPSTSTTVEGATASVIVYLLRRTASGPRLVAVQREVEDPTRPGGRIEALLQPTTPEEQARGLTSSIPTDTELLGTPQLDPTTQELVVDLSGALFDVEGTELAQAFAQIVWTVTQLEGVRRVRFLVDGEPQRAPDEDGVEQDGAVTIVDYRSLAPL